LLLNLALVNELNASDLTQSENSCFAAAAYFNSRKLHATKRKQGLQGLQ